MKNYIVIDINEDTYYFSTKEDVKIFITDSMVQMMTAVKCTSNEIQGMIKQIKVFFDENFDPTLTPYYDDSYLSDFFTIYKQLM